MRTNILSNRHNNIMPAYSRFMLQDNDDDFEDPTEEEIIDMMFPDEDDDYYTGEYDA